MEQQHSISSTAPPCASSASLVSCTCGQSAASTASKTPSREHKWLRSLHFVMKIFLIFQLLQFPLPVVSAARTRWIHWHSSNPIFKEDGENVLEVQKGDLLRFMCPNDQSEYYNLYWTTNWLAFINCSTKSEYGAFNFLKCDAEVGYQNYYQISVKPFSATFGNPSFNSPIYFFTTSTGTYSGRETASGGACSTRNMRIKVVKVEKPAETEVVPPTQSPPRPPQPQPTTTAYRSWEESQKEEREQWQREESKPPAPEKTNPDNKPVPSPRVVQTGRGSSQGQVQKQSKAVRAASSLQPTLWCISFSIALLLILTQ